MGYLKEFLTQINRRDFHKFLVLWEEYCMSDSVDVEEFSQILKAITGSDIAPQFGQIVETALPLWRTIENTQDSYEILRLFVDLQTTNSPTLAEITLETLRKVHGNDPQFNTRLRLIGLREKEDFKGAISKYDLLAHLAVNNIVFHTGGWGTGEITDVSFVREHIVVEFENVAGPKDFSFANAFKTLIPLPSSHFLARRFSSPDDLEKEARENPVAVIKMLLHDLGPKTASEIKDLLSDFVIPENEWVKWWQGARAKLKKDSIVETPESSKEPFALRKLEILPEEQLKRIMQGKSEIKEIIQTTYNFIKDSPHITKNEQVRDEIQKNLIQILQQSDKSEEEGLQIDFLLEQFFNYRNPDDPMEKKIKENENIEEIIHRIQILAFKKRTLVAIRDYRPDWKEKFLSLLFTVSQSQLRDYLLKELVQASGHSLVEDKLKQLLEHPYQNPEVFVWYFQKLMTNQDKEIPYQNKEGHRLFFESFLILFNHLENQAKYRELLKKMYQLLSHNRYALVRQLFQEANLEYTREFLLLASKCQTFSSHDKKILHSLAEVAHPSLAPQKQSKYSEEQEIIWTTQEGYQRIQERMQQIGVVEMVENAREIEAARALGDLRENSEFKFAQERRSRLQAELKTLSDQLRRARIITKEDIYPDEVGIGSIVEIRDPRGNAIRYSILGPWDADPDKNILSLNSKFAQAMIGKKRGERFNFRDAEFHIIELDRYIK